VSAIGPKRTSVVALHMSAFGGKADMASCNAHVAYDPERTSVALNSNFMRSHWCRLYDATPWTRGVNVRRRDFISLVGGVTAGWPLVARAQQPERLVRIGYLAIAPAAQAQSDDTAFREGLRDLGYVEGKNLQIEYRTAAGDESRVPVLAKELAGLNVDVIVTQANGVVAAVHATSKIPIVMAVGPDLVGLGFAASLAHPGGNVTGSTFFVSEVMAKRLELLKELAPSITRVGVLLVRRDDNANGQFLQLMRAAAGALTLELQPIEVRGVGDFEGAFSTWSRDQADGCVIGDHAMLTYNTGVIATLAANQRLPSVGQLQLPASGGLIGYGVNFSDFFRRAAYFVDQILKGTRPGDIPIEQATKFKTIVNLRTAKALGIDVPTSILLRADEVIE
jgi:putative tryptophan/tyrosine transport system substrate-binding protein